MLTIITTFNVVLGIRQLTLWVGQTMVSEQKLYPINLEGQVATFPSFI